ncbi:hypothetical protein [Kribbella italica]|uniref:DNA-binding protein n=1 Tax=Kribbella italica TaxID=1540520 RepID=A0A7W9J3T4_9ACTN|nr:hypothetical protein [Kribbella italica]MBB5835101.1 hypothetical protein [Kribbella italica]
MEVLPSQSEVFLLSAAERNLVPAGPAIIDAEGNRYDVPPKVIEALRFVETALREGLAVQVTALRHELPIREAAAAIGMAEDELRSYAASGQLAFRSDESVDWVRLEDALAFKRALKARQRSILDQMLAESDYDADPGSEGSGGSESSGGWEGSGGSGGPGGSGGSGGPGGSRGSGGSGGPGGSGRRG